MPVPMYVPRYNIDKVIDILLGGLPNKHINQGIIKLYWDGPICKINILFDTTMPRNIVAIHTKLVYLCMFLAYCLLHKLIKLLPGYISSSMPSYHWLLQIDARTVVKIGLESKQEK